MSIQTIINQDCLEYMKTLPDKSFDLVLTDPPYGIGDTFIPFSSGLSPGKLNRVHEVMDWDDEIPSKEVFEQINRVGKKVVIWGANYFNCFSKDGGALVWYKNKGAETLSQCEIASVSFQKKVDYVFIQSLGGFCANESNFHPTQKPLKLMQYCIENYSKESDTILDPFMGSGTTLVACKHLNRNCVGVEISKKYCDIAQERLDSTPTPMFQ